MNQEKNDKHKKLTFEDIFCDIKKIIILVFTYSMILALAIYGIFNLITLNSNAAAYDERVTENVTHDVSLSGNIFQVPEGSWLTITNELPGSRMQVDCYIIDVNGNQCFIYSNSTTDNQIALTGNDLKISCYVRVTWPDNSADSKPTSFTYVLSRYMTREEAYQAGEDSNSFECDFADEKPSNYSFEYNRGVTYAKNNCGYDNSHIIAIEMYARGYADCVTNIGSHLLCCARSGYESVYQQGYDKGLEVKSNIKFFNLLYSELEDIASEYNYTLSYDTYIDAYMTDLENLFQLAKQSVIDSGYDIGYEDGFNAGSGKDICQVINNTATKPLNYQGFKSMAEHIGEDYYGIYNTNDNDAFASGYADAYTEYGCHYSCCYSLSEYYLMGYIYGLKELGSDTEIHTLYEWLREYVKQYDIIMEPLFPPSENDLKTGITGSFELIKSGSSYDAGINEGYQRAAQEANEAIGEGYDAAIQKQSMMEKITTYKQLLDQRLYDVYFNEGYQSGLEYGSDLNESVNILAQETSKTLLTILNTEVYGHSLLSMLVGIVICIIVYVVVKIVGKVR